MSPAAIDTKHLVSLFPEDSTYTSRHAAVAIAGAVILGFGKEGLVRNLCEELVSEIKNDKPAQLTAFRKLREALLKASPLVGFPRSINGLAVCRSALHDLLPDVGSSFEKDKSLRGPVPLEERQKRGREFFSRIYAQHTDRVLDSLNLSSGGDLGEFAINCIYGDLVAETSILDAKETGLLEFVCCLALGAAPQAKGHMYGARNLGNTGPEIVAATKLVESIATQLEVPWSDRDMDFLKKAESW